MKNLGAETIKDSYVVKTMPDGQEVLMEKLTDGSWVTVDSRIKAQTETEKFDERFKNTDTVPANWNPQTSARLKPKKPDFKLLLETSPTHIHLHAHLIEILGQPEDIVKNGRLFKTVTDPSIRRNVTVMIRSLNADNCIWDDVLKIMNNQI
jgi:hypothetical protein